MPPKTRRQTSAEEAAHRQGNEDNDDINNEKIESSAPDVESDEAPPAAAGWTLDPGRRVVTKDDDDEEEDDSGDQPQDTVLEAATSSSAVPKVRHSPGTRGSSACASCTAVIVLLIAVIVALVFMSPVSVKHLMTSFESRAGPWETFEREFERTLKPKYEQAVPRFTFRVLKAAISEILNNLDKRVEELDERFSPAVVLLIGKERNRNMSCFVHDLESLLSESLDGSPVPHFYGEKLSASTLIEAFSDTFETKRLNVITLDGVNRLEQNAFMQLHTYSDHETAKYRKAVILLLGYTDDVSSLRIDSSMKQMDSIASEMLTNSFVNRLGFDQIEPMIARLAPSVAAVLHYPGSHAVC